MDGNGNSLRRNRPRPRSTRVSRSETFPSLFSESFRRNTFSEMSFEDAKSALRSTTGGLLAPTSTETTWHSIPLAFAMLPAIAGALFTNGEGIVTDVLILGLVAIFLHWFVKFPWEWYENSRQGRLSLESLEAASEGQEPSQVNPAEEHRRKEAITELQSNETQALLACFLGPLAGGYLMYCVRSQLSRPSGGLISNFNLTVFLLASELRPFAEVVRLARDQNDHLQQVTYQPPPSRVETLEAKVNALQAELRELATLTTKAIERDGDVDALNRAVRRYEKKETLHCVQTEARLVEMDNRLNDVLSLAAAATAQRNQQVFSTLLFEWLCALLLIPFGIAWNVIKFPKKVATKVGLLSGEEGVLTRSEPPLLLKQGNGTIQSNGVKRKERLKPARGTADGKMLSNN